MPYNSENNNNNNNNNFLGDLPKLNNEETPNLDNSNENVINSNPFQEQVSVEPVSNENKPKIEIPQKYYDNLAREAAEKEAQKELKEQSAKQTKELQMNINSLLSLSLLNAILLFVCIYFSYNGRPILFLGIPIFIIILTIIEALTKKKESIYPISLMLGSIFVAVITFIISIVKESQMDFWTYFAAMSATLGFLGLIASNIITKLLTAPKEMKALQITGSVIYFIALIGIPYYLYTYHHQELFKILFNEQVVVKAETQDEFIVKTLKTRYNKTFVCDPSSIKNYIDQDSIKVTERNCTDPQGKKIFVQTKAFNETEHKYIVMDNYLDIMYLDNIKNEISSDVQRMIETKKVDVLLYPGTECKFIGDCAESDEFYKHYKEIMDNENQFELSTKINYSNYLNMNQKDFLNKHNFKYVINISGNFPNPVYYSEAINKVLTELNNKGYKNTYGFVISMYNITESSSGELSKLVYRVTGETNNEKVFDNPIEANINGHH